MSAPAFQVTLGCMNRPWTDFPFKRALEGIQRAGFTQFGLLRHGGQLPINPDTTPDEAAAIAGQVRAHGLDLVMIPHFVRFDGSDEAALAAARRQIDHCARLGVRVLLEMGYPREEGYERYFALMRQAAPYAEAQGVIIAIKPHGGLSRTAAGTLAAVERVDHPAYRICYDAANLLPAQEERPEVSLRAMAPYVVAMCIKGATPDADGTPPSGPRAIDYREVFRILRDHSFSGPATVETLANASPGPPRSSRSPASTVPSGPAGPAGPMAATGAAGPTGGPAAPTIAETAEAIDAQAQRTYRYLTDLLASL